MKLKHFFLATSLVAATTLNAQSNTPKTPTVGSQIESGSNTIQNWFSYNATTGSTNDLAALLDTSDNTASLTNISDGGYSGKILVKGFGFNVPTNAQITGVELELIRMGSTNKVLDKVIGLTTNGTTISGDNKANLTATWTGTTAWTGQTLNPDLLEHKFYGGSTDLWGLTGVTPALLNSGNFGVIIQAGRKLPTGSGSASAIITAVKLKVFYCEPPNPTSITMTDNTNCGFTFGVANAQNITTYNWNFGDGTTSTNPTPTHTFSALGTHTVTLMASGACGQSTITKTFTCENLGIDEVEQNSAFKIYPNPAHDEINLQTNLEIENVAIYDVSGRKMMTAKSKKINVSELSKGIYIIEVTTKNNLSWKSKLIKK